MSKNSILLTLCLGFMIASAEGQTVRTPTTQPAAKPSKKEAAECHANAELSIDYGFAKKFDPSRSNLTTVITKKDSPEVSSWLLLTIEQGMEVEYKFNFENNDVFHFDLENLIFWAESDPLEMSSLTLDSSISTLNIYVEEHSEKVIKDEVIPMAEIFAERVSPKNLKAVCSIRRALHVLYVDTKHKLLISRQEARALVEYKDIEKLKKDAEKATF